MRGGDGAWGRPLARFSRTMTERGGEPHPPPPAHRRRCRSSFLKGLPSMAEAAVAWASCCVAPGWGAGGRRRAFWCIGVREECTSSRCTADAAATRQVRVSRRHTHRAPECRRIAARSSYRNQKHLRGHTGSSARAITSNVRVMQHGAEISSTLLRTCCLDRRHRLGYNSIGHISAA
jgi:hypothetical protein